MGSSAKKVWNKIFRSKEKCKHYGAAKIAGFIISETCTKLSPMLERCQGVCEDYEEEEND